MANTMLKHLIERVLKEGGELTSGEVLEALGNLKNHAGRPYKQSFSPNQVYNVLSGNFKDTGKRKRVTTIYGGSYKTVVWAVRK